MNHMPGPLRSPAPQLNQGHPRGPVGFNHPAQAIPEGAARPAGALPHSGRKRPSGVTLRDCPCARALRGKIGSPAAGLRPSARPPSGSRGIARRRSPPLPPNCATAGRPRRPVAGTTPPASSRRGDHPPRAVPPCPSLGRRGRAGSASGRPGLLGSPGGSPGASTRRAASPWRRPDGAHRVDGPPPRAYRSAGTPAECGPPSALGVGPPGSRASGVPCALPAPACGVPAPGAQGPRGGPPFRGSPPALPAPRASPSARGWCRIDIDF